MLAVGNGWFWFENGCWLSKMGHLMALMSLPVISVYCLCCSFRVQSLFVSTLITCSLSMISVVGSQYKFGRCQKRQAVAVWLENSNGKLKLVADRAVSNRSVVTRWGSPVCQQDAQVHGHQQKIILLVSKCRPYMWPAILACWCKGI